jgi:hypothetical protein
MADTFCSLTALSSIQRAGYMYDHPLTTHKTLLLPQPTISIDSTLYFIILSAFDTTSLRRAKVLSLSPLNLVD